MIFLILMLKHVVNSLNSSCNNVSIVKCITYLFLSLFQFSILSRFRSQVFTAHMSQTTNLAAQPNVYILLPRDRNLNALVCNWHGDSMHFRYYTLCENSTWIQVKRGKHLNMIQNSRNGIKPHNEKNRDRVISNKDGDDQGKGCTENSFSSG